MTPAFWDASGLVLLCIRQQRSERAQTLFDKHSVVAWWATSVEVCSAFQRLVRMGQLSRMELMAAELRFNQIRREWQELTPNDQLRAQAEQLLKRYPLKAADALQLAAAWVWSAGSPQDTIFISGDKQLLSAAKELELQVESVQSDPDTL